MELSLMQIFQQYQIFRAILTPQCTLSHPIPQCILTCWRCHSACPGSLCHFCESSRVPSAPHAAAAAPAAVTLSGSHYPQSSNSGRRWQGAMYTMNLVWNIFQNQNLSSFMVTPHLMIPPIILSMNTENTIIIIINTFQQGLSRSTY